MFRMVYGLSGAEARGQGLASSSIPKPCERAFGAVLELGSLPSELRLKGSEGISGVRGPVSYFCIEARITTNIIP